MTTTSNGPEAPEPPDIDMAEPAKPPPSLSNHKDKALTKISIKILFKSSTKQQSPSSPHKHQQVLQQLSSIDSSLMIYDKKDIALPIHQLSNIDFSQKFTYQTLPWRHFHLTGVTHSIQISIPFHQLKTKLQSILTSTRSTLTINHWPTLDVRNAGWLCNVHYYFHNRDDIQELISKTIHQ